MPCNKFCEGHQNENHKLHQDNNIRKQLYSIEQGHANSRHLNVSVIDTIGAHRVHSLTLQKCFVILHLFVLFCHLVCQRIFDSFIKFQSQCVGILLQLQHVMVACRWHKFFTAHNICLTLSWMAQTCLIMETKQGQPWIVFGRKSTKEIRGFYAETGNAKPPQSHSCLQNPMGGSHKLAMA